MAFTVCFPIELVYIRIDMFIDDNRLICTYRSVYTSVNNHSTSFLEGFAPGLKGYRDLQ